MTAGNPSFTRTSPASTQSFRFSVSSPMAKLGKNQSAKTPSARRSRHPITTNALQRLQNSISTASIISRSGSPDPKSLCSLYPTKLWKNTVLSIAEESRCAGGFCRKKKARCVNAKSDCNYSSRKWISRWDLRTTLSPPITIYGERSRPKRWPSSFRHN